LKLKRGIIHFSAITASFCWNRF